MARKGPIGKIEAFYIDHHYQLMTTTDLAIELNRTVKSVETYIKKTHTDKNKGVTEIKKKTDSLTSGDQFIRQNGATIMTENASTISDEYRKYTKTLHQNNRITNIK